MSSSKRNGISPLVAAVLLIAFTISVSALASPWITNLISNLQDGTDKQAETVLTAADSGINLMNVEYNPALENVEGYIQNTGSTKVRNITVTIHGEQPVQKRITETVDQSEITGFRVENTIEPETISAQLEQAPVSTEQEIIKPSDTVISGVFSASPGWEGVKFQLLDNQDQTIDTDTTNENGIYKLKTSQRGNLKIKAAGIQTEVEIQNHTQIDYNLSSEEITKDKEETVKTVNTETFKNCEIDGETKEIAYPVRSENYQIATVEQLQCIQQGLNKKYQLTQDIDATTTQNWNNGKGFKPVGNGENTFKGSLFGEGFVIKSLVINRPSNSTGLFKHSEGQISKLGLVDASIEGGRASGGISSKNTGKISKSFYKGELITTNSRIGGIAGINSGKIEKSYVDGYIQGGGGGSRVGGLVGFSNDGTVNESYVGGEVEPSPGEDSQGGLHGAVWFSDSGYNSYWDKESTGHPSSGGLEKGLKTDQMQGLDASTHMENFDFENTWDTTQEYPQLQWE